MFASVTLSCCNIKNPLKPLSEYTQIVHSDEDDVETLLAHKGKGA